MLRMMLNACIKIRSCLYCPYGTFPLHVEAVEHFHGSGIHCGPPERGGVDQAELNWNHIRLSEVGGRVAIWGKSKLVGVVL